jgi:type IV pilus assembly protein PilW
MTRAMPRRSAGFTLIEMMVALVVGMVVILSVVAVQKAFESQRRTSTSGNDLDNAGAYVLSQLDGALRSAGSGFSQVYTQTYGCQLYASNGGSVVVPPSSGAFPAPFENVLGASGIGGPVRMAPVIILPANTTTSLLNGGNGSSDVLLVMGGAGSPANLQTPFAGVPTSTTLNLQNAVGFNPSDLVLITDTVQAGGPSPCLVDQLDSGAISTTETFNASGSSSLTVNLSGTTYTSPLMAAHPFGVAGSAVSIGNANGNYPTFQLIGVGSNNQLMSYDLLNLQNSAPTPIGDAVMEMHALYLMNSTTGNGYVAANPSLSAYSPATLLAGTTAASGTLTKITAVRVGLILKSPLLEKMVSGAGGNWQHVAPPTLTLFNDPDLVDASGVAITPYTRTLDPAGVCTAPGSVTGANVPVAGCERDYRYRTVEVTIPLRNPMLLN